MGVIQSIIIRPEKRGEPRHITEATIHASGITGDHDVKPDGGRHVTLIAKDDLATVAAIVEFQGDAHTACRRNICVDSFPRKDMQGQRVALGEDVILEITGYCTPCNRMEENFGPGAIDAFAQRAGWTAKVIAAGEISIGDTFTVL